MGGVAYFLIDQFNTVIVQGDKASLDEDVTTVSATMVAVGLPMMLIKKRYQRVGRKYRLMVVEEGSPFYVAPLARSRDRAVSSQFVAKSNDKTRRLFRSKSSLKSDISSYSKDICTSNIKIKTQS